MLAWLYVANALSTAHTSDSEREKTVHKHQHFSPTVLWQPALVQLSSGRKAFVNPKLGFSRSLALILIGDFYLPHARNTVQQRGTSLKDSWVCGRKFPYTAGEDCTKEGAPLDLLWTLKGLWLMWWLETTSGFQRSWNDNFWFLEKRGRRSAEAVCLRWELWLQLRKQTGGLRPLEQGESNIEAQGCCEAVQGES